MAGAGWRRDLRNAVWPQSRSALIANGTSRRQLDGPRWRKVGYGYYVPASEGHPSPAQRILDATPLLVDGAALGGWAAAYVLGVDWLDGLDPHTMKALSVCIVAPDLHRRRTAEVVYRWSRLDPTDVVTRDGLWVTSGVRTAFDGARWAESLEDAVVFIDSMVAFGAVSVPKLRSYAAGHPRWTGVGTVNRALDLAREGVASGWETRLRLCWQLEARLPRALVNVPIFDTGEQFLGIADLFDPDSGLVAEFDGDQHRDREHHRRDNIREERMESANLVVVRADKVDIRRDRARLVTRLTDGYRRGTARDRRFDSWTLEQPGWWRNRQGDWG